MDETLWEIGMNYLSVYSKDNKDLIFEANEKFEDKLENVVSVIIQAEKEIKNLREYAANVMRITGKNEVNLSKIIASFEIKDGKPNLILKNKKESKNVLRNS